MPEFKIKAVYYGRERKEIFFGEKESVAYHCFSIENIYDFPGEYFQPPSVLRTNNEKGRNPLEPVIYCWLFISENLAQKLNLDFENFEKDKEYQFVVRLGEPKTAKFIATKIEKGYEYERHQLVLKTKQYFENTVKKIGYWGSENYFYEANKKKNPPKPNHSNSSQPANKNIWVKITLICLPLLIFILFILWLVKWVSKKKNN